jgi:hypothetical protein
MRASVGAHDFHRRCRRRRRRRCGGARTRHANLGCGRVRLRGSLGRRCLGHRGHDRGDDGRVRCGNVRGGRDGGGRRRGRRCFGDRPRRQERQRVDVTLLLACQPNAEVDVRLAHVDDAARSDGPDVDALGDVRAAPDTDRAEVDERGRVPRRRLDRDGLAAGRNCAGERHHALGRRDDVRARRRREIDTAVLSRSVRMRAVERERAQYGAVDRPGPGLRRRCGQDEREKREHSDSA